jgi:hypothetical protein
MIINLDKEFCCHAEPNDNTFLSIDVDFFNGKSKAYIEGYRYVPKGYVWTRKDGKKFSGEMIVPIKNYDILESVQKLYEESSAIQADTDAMLVDCEYRILMLELGLVE